MPSGDYEDNTDKLDIEKRREARSTGVGSERIGIPKQVSHQVTNKVTPNNNRQRSAQNGAQGATSLKTANIENIIFVNIETAPEVPEYEYLSADMQRLWSVVSADKQRLTGKSAAELYALAGECAEFGRIDCISVGVIRHREGDKDPYFIMQSYISDDERDILDDFATLVDREFNGNAKGRFLCGHALRQNGLPFFARRILVNRLDLPRVIEQNGIRQLFPSLIDTADFWTFSDMRSPLVSADLLAQVFGISTKADDYDAEVGSTLFHQKHDFSAITERSQRKLTTTMSLLRRFRGEEILPSDHIISK